MKKNGLIWIGVVLIISCILMIGVAVGAFNQNNKGQEVFVGDASQASTEELVFTEENTEENTEEKQMVQRIRLMMLGDNLMHMGIVYSGNQSDGTRNYDVLFEPIKEYLDYADIKMINQETIFGGNQLGFSGFPYFNSPTEVGDAIAKAGFNVVLQASNHSADQGLQGLLHAVNFWEKYPDILMQGIYEDENASNQDIGLLEIDGVTFAILNYTYSPNLGAIPKDIQGHLAMLCDWDKSTGKINYTKLHPDVLTDIEAAEQMADVVVVCPHWGTEYTFVPSSYQKKFAKQMTEAGADLIIGTHPHVIQPVEWVKGDNGNQSLCYYSLGNYVSTQQEPECMLEAMAWVTFVVEDEGVSILEEETGAIPMVCHYTSNPVRLEQVYFLDEYTQEQASAHGIHAFNGSEYNLNNLQTWAQEVLGDWILSSDSVLRERLDAEYRK